MTFLVLKTLSPPGSPPQLFLPSSSSSSSSFSFNKKNPNPRNSTQQHHYCFFSPEIQILETNGHLESNNKKEIERGLEFETGDSFFRHESAIGRDLGVLSASLYKESKGNLRVLDALCGCGVRSLRYLVQAKADFVLANDANDAYRGTILSNLLLSNNNKAAAAAAAAAVGGGVSADSEGGGGGGEPKKWLVTHSEANRLMTECYLNRDFFDLIDVDSFGSDSSFFRSALGALKIGGLLYITSTDGYTSGGHRPYHGLESYGAYVRPMPYSNEIGLRMLIGGAIRDASVLGYRVSPLFSYYSYHGPVFRVMLQVNKGKSLKNRHYGFISYCHKCGNSQAISWDKLGSMCCPCSKDEMSCPLIVSGPVWTGPLHDTAYVKELLNLAEKWGWAGNGTGMDLEKLLKQMIEESNPELPFGYIKLDEVAKRAKVNSPPLRTMMNSLHEEGYAVSRSHIASNAIKTNCPMKECIRIAQDLQRH